MQLLGENEFRHLVDKAIDEHGSDSRDVGDLYELYGDGSGTSLTHPQIMDRIYQSIRAAIKTDPRQVWQFLRHMRRELIFRYVMYGESLVPYFDVVNRIQDAVRGATSPLEGDDDWTSATRAAWNAMRMDPWPHNSDVDQILTANKRDHAMAQAAKSLESDGYHVTFEGGRAQLKKEDFNSIAQRCSQLVESIGGLNCAATIFRNLLRHFNPDQHRYHLVRRINALGTGAAPQVPVGYLLQLAAKYPSCGSLPKEEHCATWKELIAQSTRLASFLDVQPYTIWENHFKDYLNLIPFLRELALYDNMFTIGQLRPSDVLPIILGALDGADLDAPQPAGWCLREAVEVAGSMLDLCASKRGPQMMLTEDIQRGCSALSLDKVRLILDDVFAHPPPGANQHFLSPFDTPAADFMFKPLLARGNGVYFLLDISMCGSAFVEAFLAKLRESDSKVDQRIGLSLERFLRSELAKKGISSSSGTYKADGRDGECDIVVESKDCILFIEVKKKPLTRRARSGSDVDIVVDLAGSLIEAQLQAGNHELALRRLGTLELTDAEGNKARIERRGRHVERIAVTFLDYGSFQDRTILRQLMTLNLSLEYSTSQDERKKKFGDLQGSLAVLRAQVQELRDLDEMWKTHPFFNCWFLSVPQVLLLLNDASSEEDLKEALWQTRHATTGSLDFYYDFSEFRKLGRSKGSPPDIG